MQGCYSEGTLIHTANVIVRRKSWIFLVDLSETHELRERLNDPRVPLSDMLDEVAKFNAPVIAATSECPLACP